MEKSVTDILDKRIRDAYSAWKKLDETDVKILEGLSILGPRNLTLISEHLEMPTTTVRYRVQKMLDKSILFLHLNPYHTNMGLKKAVVFVEAQPGYEDILFECLKTCDYWLFSCRIYGPYEGCGGIWTVPEGRESDYLDFLQRLLEIGIAKSVDINWTTCHEGVPVRTRWFNTENNSWAFKWDEWIEEVNTIEGELPWTLLEPDGWPINVDIEDLLIIKELEIDGRKSLTDISKKIKVPLEKIKYHFREHVMKRDLVEGYQVEIFRYPSLASECLFFKFEFDSHDKLAKFALSLHDKPFPTFMGKVLGENSLICHFYLPKIEFRRFIQALSKLIQKELLTKYYYVIQDTFQQSRETIPYQHFNDGKWNYDIDKFLAAADKIVENSMPNWNGLKKV